MKDARVSLMYFNARHVEKTIIKERSPVLDMGNWYMRWRYSQSSSMKNLALNP